MRFPTILSAHGITRTGPCRVSGQHLSQAPNAPDFSEQELIEGDRQRVEFAFDRQVQRAHADEVHRLRCIGGL